MPKKNIWDDLNDWLNTDGSPSPRGSVTKGPGDFGYRTVFPWGDRKPADAARKVAEAKVRGTGRPGAWSTGNKSKPAPAPKSVGKGKDAPMPRKKK
jgi:hypothetical protein